MEVIWPFVLASTVDYLFTVFSSYKTIKKKRNILFLDKTLSPSIPLVREEINVNELKKYWCFVRFHGSEFSV
jgi:hypothetical protein